jgi:phosphatidylglycerophosphate synthase
MPKPAPLVTIILGRDLLLSVSALYIRYTSLPHPVSHAIVPLCPKLNTLEKTWQCYWDFSIPSAEVRPTIISKLNTALQLLLLGSTTIFVWHGSWLCVLLRRLAVNHLQHRVQSWFHVHNIGGMWPWPQFGAVHLTYSLRTLFTYCQIHKDDEEHRPVHRCPCSRLHKTVYYPGLAPKCVPSAMLG